MSKRKIDLKVHRPNILVSDLERSFSIYRDILGFRVNKVADALGVAYHMFGCDPETTKIRMSFLGDSKSPFGAIALTEVKGVELPKPQAPYPTNIIIEVGLDVIEEKVAKLRAAGLYVSEPYVILELPPARTDYVVIDPDGHRIVLFALHTRMIDDAITGPGSVAGDPPPSP
jgi:catechol 2,3-dioxygenase-like lactoylglutathione lyase family enzyme